MQAGGGAHSRCEVAAGPGPVDRARFHVNLVVFGPGVLCADNSATKQQHTAAGWHGMDRDLAKSVVDIVPGIHALVHNRYLARAGGAHACGVTHLSRVAPRRSRSNAQRAHHLEMPPPTPSSCIPYLSEPIAAAMNLSRGDARASARWPPPLQTAGTSARRCDGRSAVRRKSPLLVPPRYNAARTAIGWFWNSCANNTSTITLLHLSVGVRFWKLTVADPARNERCSRRKKKRGGSRARFKATVRHQVRTVRSPCSRRPATSDGVCNARATRSIAPLPGPGTRVRPRCPRRWEAGCCLLTGHALLFCSPVGDGRGRGRDSWDAPCSTS